MFLFLFCMSAHVSLNHANTKPGSAAGFFLLKESISAPLLLYACLVWGNCCGVNNKMQTKNLLSSREEEIVCQWLDAITRFLPDRNLLSNLAGWFHWIVSKSLDWKFYSWIHLIWFNLYIMWCDLCFCYTRLWCGMWWRGVPVSWGALHPLYPPLWWPQWLRRPQRWKGVCLIIFSSLCYFFFLLPVLQI